MDNLNNVCICDLSSSDVDQVLEIENSYNLNIHSKNSILKELNTKIFKYFVAKIDNKVVGFISFSHTLDIEIEAIAVDVSYTNKGVATLLLNKCFEFAKLNNIKDIFLEVRESNDKAINLYIKNGFYKTNSRERYYDNLEDAIIFKKEIFW